MKTEIELQSLQNFADEFNAIVHVSISEDKRKSPKFFLMVGGTSVSPKLDYNNMNSFLNGIYACKKYTGL